MVAAVVVVAKVGVDAAFIAAATAAVAIVAAALFMLWAAKLQRVCQKQSRAREKCAVG